MLVAPVVLRQQSRLLAYVQAVEAGTIKVIDGEAMVEFPNEMLQGKKMHEEVLEEATTGVATLEVNVEEVSVVAGVDAVLEEGADST
ncbi:uncharacterized protein IUM83_16780 [Phytophthora cinnamomi]|uniref:uncharacterized protein n=1 Tax=Phytophthora cinnamomi TaxID=4785 RepID=UPI00355A68C5|nr:hypothetical protein IUM83_16780 [Phytophthora cinnamomi]